MSAFEKSVKEIITIFRTTKDKAICSKIFYKNRKNLNRYSSFPKGENFAPIPAKVRIIPAKRITTSID